jgi:hypothetical protein
LLDLDSWLASLLIIGIFAAGFLRPRRAPKAS